MDSGEDIKANETKNTWESKTEQLTLSVFGELSLEDTISDRRVDEETASKTEKILGVLETVDSGEAITANETENKGQTSTGNFAPDSLPNFSDLSREDIIRERRIDDETTGKTERVLDVAETVDSGENITAKETENTWKTSTDQFAPPSLPEFSELSLEDTISDRRVDDETASKTGRVLGVPETGKTEHLVTGNNANSANEPCLTVPLAGGGPEKIQNGSLDKNDKTRTNDSTQLHCGIQPDELTRVDGGTTNESYQLLENNKSFAEIEETDHPMTVKTADSVKNPDMTIQTASGWLEELPNQSLDQKPETGTHVSTHHNSGIKTNEFLMVYDETSNATVKLLEDNQNCVEIIYDKHISKLSPPEELEAGSDYSELPSEPGDPIEVESSSNSISLAWEKPRKGSNNVENYEIKYKECNRKGAKWIPLVTETSRRTCTVTHLKCGTDYEFKIRAVDEDGEEGPFSSLVKFSTKLSLAKSVQIDAKKIKDGNPLVYKLPLYHSKDTTNFVAKTRKCVFGQKRTRFTEKTIMLVGATGSGKSTLIDGMINYITDVSWDDDFRFSLIDLMDEEKKKLKVQAESQTEWITCYTIHKMDGSKIDYDLNIIDTPGFGDTRGIIRDKAIIDQIREFFTTPGDQGITFLDAVCFVTQAPLARLTPPQRYIFDAILSVFGQDVASNIFVLITFADGNEPPVREALKAANVPFQKSFKFNNSALFADTGNNDEAKFGNLFWKMGQESFRIFFDELKFAESKSLQLTTEVLQLRKNLETTIQGLQPQITEGMNKLNTIRQEQEVLKRHKTDIEANRNFIYQVDEIHMRKIDLPVSTYVTNCMTCNRTCHFPCGIADDSRKQGCAAMSCGICEVCPKKCHWSVHKNNSFRFETYSVKVTKTYEELKQKYEIAQQEEMKQRSVLGKVKNAFSSLGGKVSQMIHDVRCYINKLNEIALRPNPLSDIDYIDLLIESEKNERKYGWEKRLKLFYKMRGEAELVAKSSKANFKPWGEDEKILNDID